MKRLIYTLSIIMLVIILTIPQVLFGKWTKQYENWDYDFYGCCFLNADTGWVAGSIGGSSAGLILKTTNGGNYWQTQHSTIYRFFDIYFFDKNKGIAGGRSQYYWTTNGGLNWYINDTLSIKYTGFNKFHFINQQTGWAAVESNKILKTNDAAATWVEISNPGIFDIEDMQFINSNTGWIISFLGEIYKTTDGGYNWIVQAPKDTYGPLWGEYFIDNNNGWIGGWGNLILQTKDGGNTWIQHNNIYSGNSRKPYFLDTNRGWFANDNHFITRTTNGGNTWFADTLDDTDCGLRKIVFINQTVAYAVGQWGFIYKYTYNPVEITSFSDNNFCSGESFQVSYTLEGTYNSGNIFTAQLSNSVGDFSNPINIGSVTSNTSGVINCVLPTSVSSGTGYKIRIISSNPSETGNPGTDTITINPQPSPQITGSNSVCGNEKYLYDGGTSVGNSFLWSVTGGTIEGRTDTSAVFITWDSSGTGQIKLVQAVNATGCMDSTTMDVTINTRPMPQVSGPNSVCDKSQHNYTAEISSGDSYKWYLTNGSLDSPDDGTDVWVTWTTPGAGELKLVQTNPTGCVDSVIYPVNINALPAPQIIGVSDVYSTFIEVYSAQDTLYKTCQWSVIGGIKQNENTSSTFSIKWGAQGSGYVKLIQTDTVTTCTDSTTFNVNIATIPGLTARAGADKSYCEGASVQIGTQQGAIGGVEPYTFKWTPAEGLSADDIPNPIANPLQTTVYTLTVTDAIDSTASDSVTVTVNPYPTPQIQGSTTLIVNTHTLYTSITQQGTTNNWTVENGNIDSINSNSVFVEWDSIGQGKVILEQTITATGCRASDTLNVSVWATIPNLTADAGPDKQLCLGDSVQIGSFNPALGGTQPYRYKWTPATGLDNDTIPNPTASPLQSTVYSLKVYDARDSVATDSMTVTVNQKPTPQISGNTSVMVGTIVTYSTNTSQGEQNQWSHCNKGIQIGNQSGNTYQVRWDSVGTGNVYLKQIINATGCENFDTLSVNISSTIPPVIANAGADKTICRSDSIEIGDINTASGGLPPYHYKWIPTEGLSNDTVPNPKASPRNTGVYLLTVTDSRANSSMDYVIVNVNPLPEFVINGNAQTVLNAIETYSTTLIPGTTYLWSVVNGSSQGASNGDTYQVLWNNAGTGKVIIEQTITATNCKNSDSLEVTIGEPFALPALILGNAEGSPGDVIQFPIYIRNSKYLSDSGATGINANLRFNASLLEPSEPTPLGSLTPDSKERIIQLSLGIAPQSDSTLERLYFKVMLGNDSVATLRLEDVKTNGVNINVQTTSGTFTLTGICREGGARLIGSNGQVQLMLVRPNPAQEFAEIEYETTERGKTQLYLVNALGETALWLVNGEVPKGRKVIRMNIDEIKSGTYFLILKTTTQVRSVRVDVVK